MEVVKLTARAVSWKTRVSTLDFLQAVIFNNFMLLCSDELKHDKLRKEIVQLVLDSLKDDQIEVRVKAAQVMYSILSNITWFSPCTGSGRSSSLSIPESTTVPSHHSNISGNPRTTEKERSQQLQLQTVHDGQARGCPRPVCLCYCLPPHCARLRPHLAGVPWGPPARQTAHPRLTNI